MLPCRSGAGGGLGSAVVLSVCTYVSLQAYYKGQLCRPATFVSLGGWVGQRGWPHFQASLMTALQYLPVVDDCSLLTPAPTPAPSAVPG